MDMVLIVYTDQVKMFRAMLPCAALHFLQQRFPITPVLIVRKNDDLFKGVFCEVIVFLKNPMTNPVISP